MHTYIQIRKIQKIGHFVICGGVLPTWFLREEASMDFRKNVYITNLMI